MSDRALTIRMPNTDSLSDPDPHGESDELGSFATLRTLWRRRMLIFCITMALMMAMAAVIWSLERQFRATSYIMIEPGNTKIADAVAAVMVGAAADSEMVQSEVRVLESRALADRVITRLRLDEDPEFNSSLRPPVFLDKYLVPVKAQIAQAVSTAERWIAGDQAGRSEADSLAAKRARIIDRFLSHLEPSVDGLSRVVTVNFTSTNPKTAANAANAVADLYLEAQLDAKFEAAKSANRWLNERIGELREQVETAEAAVEQYRAQNDLIATNDVKLSTQQATELGAQLVLARSQRAEAEARLRELQGAVGGSESISEVLKSGTVAQLRAQEAEIEARVADLAQDHGANHPDLIKARAELAQVKAKIQIEVRKVTEALRNEVVAARAREASLSDSLDKLKSAASEQNQVEVKLRALEREAAASRTLLETFLKRAQETSSQEDFQNADARIISRADVPQSPVFPKWMTLLLASFLGCLAIGILVALLLEMMSRGFRSEEEVERVLGAASLGLVPSLKRTWSSRERPPSYVMKNPASAYVESIRNLYAGLTLSNGQDVPRVVLIASSLPKEGKTTVAVSLAALLSASGQKAIVVDADLRKPAVHRMLGIASGPGLADYLEQQLPLDSIIQQESVIGIAAITAGSRAAGAPNLLGSMEQMSYLLQQLKATYDVIILDSAPVLAVSDTRMLAGAADRTVFLVRWEETQRNVAARGLQQILKAGGKVAGIMLTMVNFEKYAKYRYGAFGHYYRRIEGYYGA